MKRLRIGLVVLVAAAACAAPAAARDRVVTIASDGPGPEAYDRVFVHQIGPKQAERVLVLMPGTIGGAGDFTLLGRDLTKRVDDLQVWAIDRRSQALEETAIFEQALAGRADPAGDVRPLPRLAQQRRPARRPLRVPRSEHGSRSRASGAWRWRSRTPARWSARRGRRGRQVLLGGHSLGASLTAAYAAWDFDGKPGYRGRRRPGADRRRPARAASTPTTSRRPSSRSPSSRPRTRSWT